MAGNVLAINSDYLLSIRYQSFVINAAYLLSVLSLFGDNSSINEMIHLQHMLNLINNDNDTTTNDF